MKAFKNVVAALVVLLVFATTAVFAQSFSESERDPRLKEGQMFVVRLVPAGKRLEVLVTGREVASLEADQLGLQALLRMGDKTVQVSPKRAGAKYYIDVPAGVEPTTLKLNLNYKQNRESFEFDLGKTQR